MQLLYLAFYSLCIYIPDTCGAVLKPFVVFISGSDKKWKCILCTTSEAACMVGYPCSSTVTNTMYRCMHTHNTVWALIFAGYIFCGFAIFAFSHF